MMPRIPAVLFVALAGAGALTAEQLAAAPRYRMVLDASQAEQGVQTVSLVKNPAIQRGWVALAAVEPTAPAATQFHLSAEPHQQVLTGPALIPGQQILRLDADGNPFFITFDAENIRAIQRQYAKQLRQNNSNEDHLTDLDGNVVEESWIIADAACDKAVALGLPELPAGTWMLSMHIPDTEYWQREIISGNKLGFSIEGLFNTEQLNLSAVAPAPVSFMKGLIQKLGAVWATLTGEQRLALGLEELADGRAVSIDDMTGAVTLCNTGEALPDGQYPLKNGGELVVQAGKRADSGSQGEPATNALANDAGAATEPTAPAPLPDTAGLPDVVKTLNEVLGLLKKDATSDQQPQTDPSKTPAGQKLAAALDKVALADLGPKLTELKLDAIELADGSKLTYNAVTGQLSDKDGALVKSGWYAAADGSYFSVNTDQYIYEISKTTYDSVYAKLSADARIKELEAQLARTPAATRVNLGGDGAAPVTTGNTVKSRAAARLAMAEATR